MLYQVLRSHLRLFHKINCLNMKFLFFSEQLLKRQIGYLFPLFRKKKKFLIWTDYSKNEISFSFPTGTTTCRSGWYTTVTCSPLLRSRRAILPKEKGGIKIVLELVVPSKLVCKWGSDVVRFGYLSLFRFWVDQRQLAGQKCPLECITQMSKSAKAKWHKTPKNRLGSTNHLTTAL